MKSVLLQSLCITILLAAGLLAQDAPSTPAMPQTKIQVNFLNPCHPAEADLEAMARALAQIKDKPSFTPDFEIFRGLTTLSEAEAQAAGAPAGSGGTPSTWVRIRREFPEKAILTNVQYSLSVAGGSTSEVLALHLRDSREVLEILISDSVTGRPAEVVQVNTPPERIRIERFGKPSIVLARCGALDQSVYEPMFRIATGIFEKYRAAMAVRTVVAAELARLPGARESKTAGANH